MEHVISSDDYKDGYEIGATGLTDILQCVHVLISTVQGTVFLDRSLGLDPDIIDSPQNQLGRINQNIYEQIERYEPRAEVRKIDVSSDPLTGRSEIRVRVKIDEEFI